MFSYVIIGGFFPPEVWEPFDGLTWICPGHPRSSGRALYTAGAQLMLVAKTNGKQLGSPCGGSREEVEEKVMSWAQMDKEATKRLF